MKVRTQTPVALVVSFILSAPLLGCGEGTASRVRLALEVHAHGSTPFFDTEKGWSVEVEAARLAIESLRFYETEPKFAGGRWALVSPVFAHPGHHVPGEAMAEVLTPVVLDLRADAPVTSSGEGVSGYFGSADVRLKPRSGVTAFASGRARRGGRRVDFDVSTDLDVTVDGIAVGSEVTGDVSFDLAVDLSRWLGRIDFDALPATTSTVTFEGGSQGHNAFLRGVNDTSAFIIEKE